jgi:hypothetical protein
MPAIRQLLGAALLGIKFNEIVQGPLDLMYTPITFLAAQTVDLGRFFGFVSSW